MKCLVDEDEMRNWWIEELTKQSADEFIGQRNDKLTNFWVTKMTRWICVLKKWQVYEFIGRRMTSWWICGSLKWHVDEITQFQILYQANHLQKFFQLEAN